ncbi:hypothetical protein FXO37_17467 [Capsicum annuum]|nr:hypothetical protein FXO37_17467 [Capsicum annuum]
MSSNHLYHAYAWLKLFSFLKGFNKNLSQKDLQLIASSIALAALSMPPYDQSHDASHLDLKNYKERSFRCNFLAIKVDHIKGVVFFGKQRIEAKELREHISLFAESLSKARTMISLLEL